MVMIQLVQLETGENIVMENPHYVYEPKQGQFEYDFKEWQYDIKDYEYDIKYYKYDPEYPEGTEEAEQHKVPIYWTEEDQDYENHRTPVYYTEDDLEAQEHRTAIYYTENDTNAEEHRTQIYYREEDPDAAQYRTLVLTEEDIDSNGEDLVLGDKFITFSIRNYNVRGEGDITDSHQGRFPYRVIDKIVKKFQNRDYFTSGTAQIGDLYLYESISNEDYSYVAICIVGGELPTGYDIFNQNTDGSARFSDEPIPGIYFGKAQNDCIWRILQLPT